MPTRRQVPSQPVPPPTESMDDGVWDRRRRMLWLRDPVLDDSGCGCRTDRRGTYQREDACRGLL